jgi:predicted Fe-S protein YdhL (DUF1289 family)
MCSVSASPLSPCVQVCVLEPDSGWCVGCGRTIEEIMAWGSLDEGDRLGLMAGLPERLKALAAAKDAR